MLTNTYLYRFIYKEMYLDIYVLCSVNNAYEYITKFFLMSNIVGAHFCRKHGNTEIRIQIPYFTMLD
jgi:hypothetical protein